MNRHENSAQLLDLRFQSGGRFRRLPGAAAERCTRVARAFEAGAEAAERLAHPLVDGGHVLRQQEGLLRRCIEALSKGIKALAARGVEFFVK